MKRIGLRLFAATATALFPFASPLPFASAGPPASTPARPSRLSPLASLPSARPNTSPSGITVRANYANPSWPFINVTFVTPLTVPLANVVEYHVYRNNLLVMRFTRADLSGHGREVTFQDMGSPLPITPVTNKTIKYVTVNIGDPYQLSDARSLGVGLFTANVPIVYRVTLLQSHEGVGGRAIYTETEIGRSNSITPYR